MSTTDHNHKREAPELPPVEVENNAEVDEHFRRAAEKSMPSRAQLEAMIARRRSTDAQIEDSAEVDEYYRRLAERISPTRAELDAIIAKRRPSAINYDHEDDELPC